MKIECCVYTRTDKKKSALERKNPTEKFIVNLKNNKITKVFKKNSN